MAKLLSTKNLSKTYSGICVLNNIDFDLFEGEVHAIVGENGAGKSTFIKMIAGVVSPDNNSEITINGDQFTRLSVAKSRALGISVIYQDISLFPNLTVAENICLGMKLHGLMDWKSVQKTARAVLERIGSDIDPNTILSQLSVGQQQLVAIARAIIFDARIIIMDEPTSSLSSSEVEKLFSIICDLKKDGIGIIYISHKFEEIFSIADRVSVFRDGNLIKTDKISAFDQQSLINLMVGRELLFVPYRMEGEPEDVIFSVKNLTLHPFFHDISFDVRRNEVLGITGLVGAGRSEVAQAIFGLLPKDNGNVFINGKEVFVKNAKQAISEGIAYLPEDRLAQGLFLNQSVSCNLTAASMHKIINRIKLLSRNKAMKIAHQSIKELNIKPSLPDIAVQKLSGGNQQKVLASKWLNANPKVLIVDEVTTGVDLGVKTEIHRLLRLLASQGVAVVMISSDLPEVLAVADKILVMRKGKTAGLIKNSEATQELILEKGMIG